MCECAEHVISVSEALMFQASLKGSELSARETEMHHVWG